MLAKTQLIIWDMDGTLVDSSVAVPDAYIETIADCGGPLLSRGEIVSRYHLGPPARILTNALDETSCGKAVELFQKHLSDRASDITPYDGIVPTLRALDGTAHAVFTGSSADAAETILAATGLRVFFRKVIGGDQVERAKPAPDGLLAVCEAMGVFPGNAAYVGDSEDDMAAAQNAGVLSISAGWGHLYKRNTSASIHLTRPEDLAKLRG